MMGTEEIIFEQVYGSPRLPPKISFKDKWIEELGSEVAGGSKDSQQTQPQTKNPIVRTRRLQLLKKSTNVSCLNAKAPM